MGDTAEGGDGKCRGQEHEEPQRKAWIKGEGEVTIPKGWGERS